MKIRVSFEVDVTGETAYDDNSPNRVPITNDNALNWYYEAFDAWPNNYAPGFITNTKAEVIEP